MAAITLFRLPQVVTVVMAQQPAGETMITSFHHTRSDFKIYWNVQNDIDFLIKDVDSKAQAIPSSRVFDIIISHPRTGDLLLRRRLTTASQQRGHLRLSLTAQEATDLPIGNLTYAVVAVENELEFLLFTDRDHGPQARLEVKYGPVPAKKPPVEIQRAAFFPSSSGLVAGAHAGPAQTGSNGVQSVQITGDGWTGRFIIEGSLEPSAPGSDTGWFVIEDVAIDGLNANRIVDFDLMVDWVRFRIVEDEGSLARIIYRS